MKTITGKVLIAFFLFAVIQTAFAQQVKYQEFLESEELLVEYRWQHERVLRKSGNAILNLQITNLLETPLEVAFTVAFYRDGQLVFESEENVYCFKPGQRRRGGRAALRYYVDGWSMEDVKQENFSWDLLIDDIRKVPACE